MIYLEKAQLKDRKKIYQWLYYSDYSPFLNKLLFKTSDDITTYEQFEEDYEDYYFEGTDPEKGRGYLVILEEDGKKEEIGFISYGTFHLREGIVELDIWLKSNEYTGKGYGTEAVKILSLMLLDECYNILIMRPCAKNQRAVNSYKKAGFKATNFKPEYYKEEFLDELAPGDGLNGEDVFMELKSS